MFMLIGQRLREIRNAKNSSRDDIERSTPETVELWFGQFLGQLYLQLRSTAFSCPPSERLASPYVSVAERLLNSAVEPVLILQKTFSDNVALRVHHLREF